MPVSLMPGRPMQAPSMPVNAMLARKTRAALSKPLAALKVYRLAQKSWPTRVELLAGQGLSLLDLNNPDDAQSAFEQAVGINPRYGPALMGLAEVYRMQKKNDKAIEFYEKYLEVLPDGTEASVARNNIARLKK
jgi:tetratricopeptide (TPR) repeat protein